MLAVAPTTWALTATPTFTQTPAAGPTIAATSTPTANPSTLGVPGAAATLIPGYEYYTIQAGDTLFRIALRFRTNVRHLAEINGIVNPALIFAGQRIQVPSVVQPTAAPSGTAAAIRTSAPASATPTPVPTSAPGTTTTYTVVAGDTLFRIAVRFNTTVARLLTLNPNITNPSLIYVGQRITVPTTGTGAAAAASATPASVAAVTNTPVQQAPAAQAEQGGGTALGFGITVFPIGQDTAALIEQVQSMGLGWVKVNVYWRDLEVVEGEIDFETLDSIVEPLNEAGLSILFTVTTAPDWSRSTIDESGPPDDFETYGTFVGALAERYARRVQAYEIWNEPNLRREWNSATHTINAGGYVELLQIAYEAIKESDPQALVVSAGLAPTGFNDGVNAINDRLFLQGMYANGLAEYSDAIGAHPNGWANPPDARCCDQPEGVASHYQDPSFFFLDTLSDYHEIMVANGDDRVTPIWVTQFGWGTTEDSEELPENSTNVFLNYTSLDEQADYAARAFQIGEELGYVGAMFLNNLNACQGLPGDQEACYYSLVNADGDPRPALQALQGEG
jgi:LysM repeat protein